MYDPLELHRLYQPKKTKLLFIAEAPGNTDKHFYLGNTNLFRTVYRVFKEVFGDFESNEAFFHFFKSLGCFLDHLSFTPIDKSSVKIRKAFRTNGILPLSKRISKFNPQFIIIVMKSIENEVKEAVKISGVDSIDETMVTAYPAGTEANRQACIRDIKIIISRLTSTLT